MFIRYAATQDYTVWDDPLVNMILSVTLILTILFGFVFMYAIVQDKDKLTKIFLALLVGNIGLSFLAVAIINFIKQFNL